MILSKIKCGPLCGPLELLGSHFFISTLHINWRLNCWKKHSHICTRKHPMTLHLLVLLIPFHLCTWIIHFFFTFGALFSSFLRISISWTHLAPRWTWFVTEGTRLACEAFRRICNSCKINYRSSTEIQRDTCRNHCLPAYMAKQTSWVTQLKNHRLSPLTSDTLALLTHNLGL